MSDEHRVILGDSRNLDLSDGSIHLVVTSPPYANLIDYEPNNPSQLGDIDDYDKFLDALDDVWEECFRLLVPGGRLVVNVGDVCVPRKSADRRHHVLPLGADIQVRARKLGFDNLTPIRWLKVSNIKMEGSRSSRFLGKPNLPGGVIKNDIEHILMLRKPGGYRKPTGEQIEKSFIPTDEYARLFAPVWSDVSGKKKGKHPAPYPVEIPRRLIRMFSFWNDVVLDPFAGSGSTALAAKELGRQSISVDCEAKYVDLIREVLQ